MKDRRDVAGGNVVVTVVLRRGRELVIKYDTDRARGAQREESKDAVLEW